MSLYRTYRTIVSLSFVLLAISGCAIYSNDHLVRIEKTLLDIPDGQYGGINVRMGEYLYIGKFDSRGNRASVAQSCLNVFRRLAAAPADLLLDGRDILCSWEWDSGTTVRWIGSGGGFTTRVHCRLDVIMDPRKIKLGAASQWTVDDMQKAALYYYYRPDVSGVTPTPTC